jgi:hypothetical protein
MADKAVVEALARRLREKEGIQAWPGQVEYDSRASWQPAIEDALKECDCARSIFLGPPFQLCRGHRRISGGANWDDRTLRTLAEEIDVAAGSFLSGTRIRAALSSGSNISFLTPFCTWVPFLKSTSPKRSCGQPEKRRTDSGSKTPHTRLTT